MHFLVCNIVVHIKDCGKSARVHLLYLSKTVCALVGRIFVYQNGRKPKRKNNMKKHSKILLALLAVALLVCIATVSLAACNKHKHIYSYDYDEEYHWQVCLDCGETTEKEAHVVEEWVTTKPATYDEDGEAKGECTVCGKTVQKTLTKLPLSPTDQESEKLFDLEYHSKDGNNPAYYSIGEYKGTATEVVIPSTYKDVPITEISFGYSSWDNVKSLAVEDDNPTFQSQSGVLYKKGETPSFYFAPKALEGEVNILDGVTEIPREAFSGRVNVTELTIPDSVTNIGYKAFYDCDSIKELTVPKNVTSVGELAFGGMDNLMEITWDAFDCDITTYDRNYGVFYGSAANIASVNRMNGIWVHICPNCENIDDYTFAGLDIDTIFIDSGSSLKSIGEYAFAYCRTLRSISGLTDDVTVADTALYGSTTVMHKLQDLDPNKLYYDVGGEGLVFYEESKNNFTLVDYNLNGIFNVLNLPKKITINRVPYDYYKIGRYAFAYRKDPVVTIPSAVTEINSWAFEGFRGTKINLDENTRVEEQDNIVYKYVNDEPSILYVPKDISGDVKILNGVTEIPEDAFSSCKDMKSITIPDSVTSIGDGAFRNCTEITKVNVTSLKSWCEIEFENEDANPLYAAKGNAKLYLNDVEVKDDVNIPTGTNKIGASAFYGLTGITSVTIPDSVTSIGNDAFRGCKGLQTVTIGKGVTSIGYYAFEGCTGITKVDYLGDLKSWCEIEFGSNPLYAAKGNAKLYLNDVEVKDDVDIPTGTAKIGNYAFYGLKGITSVTIPVSVQSIGSSAFGGCTGLKSFKVAEGNSVYQSKDGIVYLKETKSIYLVPKAIEGTVAILDGCTGIGNSAFSGLTGLKELTIPESVTSIGENAFEDCEGLQTVTIGKGVQSIGQYAFYKCTGLQTVNWNATNCTRAGLQYNYIFEGCTQLTKVNIGDKVQTIPAYAFYRLTGITSVTIPDSVQSIGSDAFSGCTGLSEITIPDSVTSIGSSAFSDTPWYNALPDGVVYIGKVLYAYKGEMSENTTINIKDGTVSISPNAFNGCTGLIEINIPNSVTSIGGYAFYDCTGLQSVTIGDSVQSIGQYAFSGCTGLKEITIPDSVQSIREDAFYKCTGLQTMTIGEGVTSIGNYAFDGCEGIQAVYYGGTSEQWNDISIGSNNSLKNAKRYYFSEQPNYDGKHWHWNEDTHTPEVWVKEN